MSSTITGKNRLSVFHQIERIHNNRGKALAIGAKTPAGHTIRARDVIGKDIKSIERRMAAVDKMRTAGTLNCLWRIGYVEEVDVDGVTWEIVPGVEVDYGGWVANIRIICPTTNKNGMLITDYRGQKRLVEEIKREMGIRVQLLDPLVGEKVAMALKESLKDVNLCAFWGNATTDRQEEISKNLGYEIERLDSKWALKEEYLCHFSRYLDYNEADEARLPRYLQRSHKWNTPVSIFLSEGRCKDWLGCVIGRPK